jgi:ureidoacrylate peracid hydrolase
MQKGFLDNGAPIFVKNGKKIIKNIKELIVSARDNKIKVIWTRVSIEYMPSLYRKLFPLQFQRGKCRLEEGNSYFDIIDELKSSLDSEDLIINKYSYSAFKDTKLHAFLSNKGISKLVFTGVTTNVCVESSIRDAFSLGYESFLISDCTKSFNNRQKRVSEEIISLVFGYVKSKDEFIREILK